MPTLNISTGTSVGMPFATEKRAISGLDMPPPCQHLKVDPFAFKMTSLPSSPVDPADKIREILAGYPPATVDAALEFATKRSAEALDRLVLGVIAFHLPRSEDRRRDLSLLPEGTKLVADLSFDSLAVVEVNFLFSDLLGVNLSDEELHGLVTLNDLRSLIRKHLGLQAAS